MADVANPLSIVSDLLAPVFAEIAGRPDADPVVRPSDRADAQVNGALPLAKQIGSNPREIAQQVVDSGVLADVCSDVEIAGPGFINLTFATSSSPRSSSAVAIDDRLGVEPAVHAHRRRRLLGAERRQGDARRPPALDGDRRRPGADARVRRSHGDPREPHRRLGPTVRDADRAPARPRRGRRRGRHQPG